jgi:hypothetical protein
MHMCTRCPTRASGPDQWLKRERGRRYREQRIRNVGNVCCHGCDSAAMVVFLGKVQEQRLLDARVLGHPMGWGPQPSSSGTCYRPWHGPDCKRFVLSSHVVLPRVLQRLYLQALESKHSSGFLGVAIISPRRSQVSSPVLTSKIGGRTVATTKRHALPGALHHSHNDHTYIGY